MEVPEAEDCDEFLISDVENDSDDEFAGEINKRTLSGSNAFVPQTTRLVFCHIVVTNFKSFAGSRTLGPFHEKLTAIVGPNGSGKSNIIDAILFVFGLKGNKLRSKNVASVIHCSEKFPNLSSCTVQLHFCKVIDQTPDSFEVIPNSEVVVSRTVHKDNSSFYMLNDQVVKFETIKTFLKSHGVDLVSGRYLILQGEVEQVSMMKPKGTNEKEIGFLEYLEDVFGSLKYKNRCENILEKLEKVKMAVEEKNVARNVAREEMTKLKEERDAAVLQIQAKNEIARLSHILYQKYEMQMQQKIEMIKNDMQNLNVDLDEHIKKSEELVDKKKEINNKLTFLKITKGEVLSQIEKLNEEVTSEKTKIEVFIEQIDANKKQRERGTRRLAAVEPKLQRIELIPSQLNKEMERLTRLKEKTVEELQIKEDHFNQMITDQMPQLMELTENHKNLLSQLVIFKEASLDKKINFDLAKSRLESYEKQIDQAHAKRKLLETELKNNENILNEQKRYLEETDKKITEVEADLAKQHAEINFIKHQHVVCQSELHRKRKHLQDTKSCIQAVESMRGPVAHLIKAKREGKLPNGVYGRLGDLGGIEKKYQTAVSEACGRLDNIVVDSVYTAQMCMELMKREKLGRGTFLPLEKHQHLHHTYNKNFKAPEGVPRLFDLIQVEDDCIRPAFYFALGDTLVAENLHQANRISFYKGVRHRVVTLQGNVVETSGTMTGGKRTNRPVGMGETATVGLHTVSVEEALGMEKELAHTENNYINLCSALDELANSISSNDRWLTVKRLETCKLRDDIKHKIEMQTVLQKQLEAEHARQPTLFDPELRAELESEFNSAKTEYNTALAAYTDVENKAKEVKDQLDDIRFRRSNAARKAVVEAKNKYTEIERKIRKVEFAIQSVGRKKAGILQAIGELRSGVIDLDRRLKELSEEVTNCKTLLLEHEERLQELQILLQRNEEDLKKTSNDLKSLLDEETQLKLKIVDIRAKIDEKNKMLKSSENSLVFFCQKITSLKPQVIPGVETQETFCILTPDELNDVDIEKIEYDISILSSKTSVLFNESIIEEFQQKEEKFEKCDAEYKDFISKRDILQEHYDIRWKKRFMRFMCGFNFLCAKLKEIYQLISLGGEAEFEIIDRKDPFSEGIAYSVRPPQKSWKNISILSGGEKTLSSLALVFALHCFRPSPFYIMDEIDAALDSRNTAVVGLYIKTRAMNAQFIIISLRSGMFELPHRVVGVYKQCQQSASLTINTPMYIQNEEDSGDQSSSKSVIL